MLFNTYVAFNFYSKTNSEDLLIIFFKNVEPDYSCNAVGVLAQGDVASKIK